MTAEAGPDYAGFTVSEAREKVVAALDRAGPHPPPRALHAHRAVQPPLGRAHRAADLAAVVHGAWTSWPRRRSRPSRTGRVRIHPESQSRRYLEWLRQHPPVVHLAPAVVGPPDPGLVPRGRGDLRRPRAAGGRGLGARSRRARHVVLLARCGRSRRSAGPSETAELRAFYPTDVLSTARDILFLWVARMVMMGLEFTGDVPFTDVYVHSVIQAPDGRRMSKSLGTGIDPLDEIDAHGADAVRFGLLAMSEHAGRALLLREGPPGPGAGQQALQRRALRAAATSAPRPSPTPRPTTVQDRWILSRLQEAKAQFDAQPRRLRLRQGRARPLRLRLRRAVRLVPRVQQGAASTTTTCRPRCSTCCARRSLLAHPVIPFVTEELWSHVPGRRGPAGRAAGDRGRRRRCATPTPRRAWAPSIAAVTRAALLARRAPASSPAQVLPARAGRPRRRRRARGADGAPGPRRRRRADRGRAVRGRHGRDPRRRARRPGRGGAQARRRARAPAAARSRAPRASWPTRASWPRRPTQLVAAEREKLDRLRRELEAAVTLAERRALPARPRAVRHALRPGPHAPADDRAGLAAGALRVDPRRRHQRQVLDGAHDRGDPAPPRPAHRHLPLAAPRLLHRARAHRRRRTSRPSASPPPSSAPRRAAEKVDRTLAADDRVTQFEALTAAAYDELAARRGARSPSIEAGPRRALRRDQRDPLARAGADQRRPRAHALAGADGGRHRAGEARRGAARRDARGRRRPASRRAGAGASARAPSAARGWSWRPMDRSRARSRCWPAAPSSGATSRSRAPPPRPTWARWTRTP